MRSTLKRSLGFAGGAILGAIVTLSVVPLLSAAHPVSENYVFTWKTGTYQGIDQDRTVGWHFVDSVPVGARDVIKKGSWQWNQVSGTPMTFDFESGQSDFTSLGFSSCDPNTQYWYQNNRVGWTTPADHPGDTAMCTFADDITKYFNWKMKFDPGENWYKEEGNPSFNQDDLWTVATHEFGHASGFLGHFAESADACRGDQHPDFHLRHSMCPTYYEGTTIQRSLEEHDRHTFRSAY